MSIVPPQDGVKALLGCRHARRFLEVDVDTIHAVEAIARTDSLHEAERLLKSSHDLEADLVELGQKLYERGFVKEVDGEPVHVVQSATERHPLLHSIPARAVAWMHNRFLWLFGVALITQWFLMMFLFPDLRPSVSALNVSQHPSVTLSITLAGALLMSYVHELAHFFTARSFGIQATIHVSHRFLMPVLQTDVTNSWALRGRDRLLIFLAGMMFNMLTATMLTYALAGHAAGVYTLSASTIRALEFFLYLNIFPLFFQFFITARTDLYHAALVLTKQRNLYADSRAYLGLRFRRAWARVRGRFDDVCAECSGPTLANEPFCPRCGHTVDERSPLFRVTKKNRHMFASFGILMFFGGLFAYGMVYNLLSNFVVVWLVRGAELLAAGLAVRDWAAVTDGAVAVVFAGSKLTFAGFFFWRTFSPRFQAIGKWLANVRGGGKPAAAALQEQTE